MTMTTTQVCCEIVKPATAVRNCAYVDLLVGQCQCDDFPRRASADAGPLGQPLTGPATVFVSHAWSCKTLDVFQTMLAFVEQDVVNDQQQDQVFFWFDVFCNNQHGISSKPYEWFGSTFKDRIASIGTVLQVMTPWDDPVPLKRAWCLWETFCALEMTDSESKYKETRLVIRLPPNQRQAFLDAVGRNYHSVVTNALAKIQAQHAEADKPEDRDNIFKAMERSGGFDEVNAKVKTQLREWLLSMAVELAEEESQAMFNISKYLKETPACDRAIVLLSNLVKRRIAENGESSEKVANLYNSLGIVYKQQGQYDKALESYGKALTIDLGAPGGDNHPSTAATYTNMADVYNSQGLYDQALEYNDKALRINLATLGDNHPKIATIYMCMALGCDSQGQYDRALEHYGKALGIRLATLGGSHPRTADIYHNMAIVYQAQGQFDKTLEYYGKALTICLVTLGDNHPDTANTYMGMANVCYLQGQCGKALEYYGEALTMRLATRGENHLDTAGCYQGMAITFNSQGQYDKALEYHVKVLTIRLARLGDNHLDTAGSYVSIADVYFVQGQYDKALDFCGKALTICLSTPGGDNHQSTATTYSNMANIFFVQGHHDKALEYHGKAMAIKLATLGDSHPSTADTYNNMAVVYDTKGEYDKALEYYAKALTIDLGVPGGCNHLNTAGAYHNMAYVYYSQGQDDKALEYYGKALSIKLATLGDNHPSTAATYFGIGVTLIMQGLLLPEGIASVNKGLQIYRKVFGPSHPETVQYESYLDSLLEPRLSGGN